MKCVIRDDPEELGGVDFFSLVHVQGIAQITHFLKHWRTDLITNNLLHIALAWCQYQVGTGHPIFENAQQKLPHLEARWIPSFCQYLQLIEGSIKVDNAYIPYLQREHDDYIMDIILESKKFTDNEVCTLNYCQLYLQATTLADLTLADGATLDPQF
eukprot:3654833-Ditylum_brightwellii.AAC.1